MVTRYSIILLLCLMQSSCFDYENQQECLTSDTVAIIDITSANKKNLFLVYRISGWHDKIESFELYNTQPIFNICGESTIQPIFRESIDEKDINNNDQHVAHIYFTPPDTFILDYEAGPQPDVVYNKSLTLELKNTQ
jgi:hypothetical protein